MGNGVNFFYNELANTSMNRGRPRTFDMEQALDTALKLFWQHGYEGTSIALLADAIGVNPPSLYAAFGNKEELFVQTIERYVDLNGHIYRDSLQKETAQEVAQGILEGVVKLVTRPGSPNGCLMVQGALATSPDSEKISRMVARLRGRAEGWLVDRFERARQEGDLPPDADPHGLACYLMTLNSGLAVQAKSGISQKQLLKVVAIALQSWPRSQLRTKPRLQAK